MRVVRWCHRCQARTDHVAGEPAVPLRRWVLLWSVAWRIDQLADPPSCLLCLERDQGDPT
jgi:hypothetical protein